MRAKLPLRPVELINTALYCAGFIVFALIVKNTKETERVQVSCNPSYVSLYMVDDGCKYNGDASVSPDGMFVVITKASGSEFCKKVGSKIELTKKVQ